MTRIAFYDPDANTSYVSGLFDVPTDDAAQHFHGTNTLLDFMSRLAGLEEQHPTDPVLPGTRMTVLHSRPPMDAATVIIRKN